MKNKLLLFSIIIMLATVIIGCSNGGKVPDLWNDAVYDTDVSLGKGEKKLILTVKTAEKSITITVNTDKETVGDALFEQKIIDGDKGPYGLYVKKVNGITADFDVDGHYWSFTINGEMAPTGADSTPIKDGEVYGFEYV